MLCELDRSESTYLLEESASPFIDEGNGLTSERERVRMLLSLVAHAGGYKDDGRCPQYCLMSDARGRLHRLLLVWQTSVPVILLMPRDMQGVLLCSPGTINASAHNTVDAQRHVGDPYRVCLVWELMAPTTL